MYVKVNQSDIQGMPGDKVKCYSISYKYHPFGVIIQQIMKCTNWRKSAKT